eukprot:15434887-Alexandrium_andersonii.AAC.1
MDGQQPGSASPVNQMEQAPRAARDRRRPAVEEPEGAAQQARPRARRHSPARAPSDSSLSTPSATPGPCSRSRSSA